MLSLTALSAQVHEQSFAGIVSDTAGRPVELAVVAATPGDVYAVTDVDGAFRLVCNCERAVTHLDVTHVAYDPIRVALDSVGDPRLRH